MRICCSRAGNFWFSLFLILALSQSFVVRSNFNYGNFTQSGTLSLKKSSLRVQEVFKVTGQVIAEDLLDCVCGTLCGNGLLKGSTIKIIAKDFQFKGIIECDGECVITTVQPFDHSMCTFKGKGVFSFVVDDNVYNAAFSSEKREDSSFRDEKLEVSKGTYSQEQLVMLLENFLKRDGILSLTQKKAENFVEEIALCAKESNLNIKEIFDLFLNKLHAHIEYNKSRIGKKSDLRLAAIGATMLVAGLGSLALCAKYLGAPDLGQTMTPKDSAYVASIMVAFFGVAGLENGLKIEHQYEVKYAHLLMLEKAIEKLFASSQKLSSVS